MLQLKRFDPNTPLMVKPLLTLANKYEIQLMRANIVRKLEEDWPQSLSEWDELGRFAEAKVDRCAQDLRRDHLPDEYPDACLPEPGSAVHVGRHCNVPNILPAAFYHLYRTSIEHNWEDTHVLRNDDIPDCHELWGGARTARWDLISKDDLVCVLLGRERLKRVADYFSVGCTGSPKRPHTGKDQDGCKSKNWAKVWHVVERKCNQSSDVLKTISDIDGILQSSGNPALCWMCDEDFRNGIDKLRNDIWNNLHEHFDLPPRA